MSSKKTDYLKMHDWTEADPWRLAEVSENFKKMDKKAKDLDSTMATTVSTAADAKTTANGIDAKATDALAKSTEAVQNVSTAVQKANSAESKATEAKTVSDNALAKAGTAESIANGVQTQFNQVVITGDSSVEAAQARVNTSGQTYSTLKQRLDSEHQEVTVKLAETDVEARRKKEPEDLSERTLALVTGNGTVNILSKPQENSVSAEQTTFVKRGKNLFTEEGIHKNKMINRNTGALGDTPNVDTTVPIPILPGIAYFPRWDVRYSFIDATGQFISAGGSDNIGSAKPGTAFTTPSNARYVQLSYKPTLLPMQLEIGSEFTSYEPPLLNTKNLIAFDRAQLKLVQTVIERDAVGQPSKIIERINGQIIRETSLTRINGILNSITVDDKELKTIQKNTLIRTEGRISAISSEFL